VLNFLSENLSAHDYILLKGFALIVQDIFNVNNQKKEVQTSFAGTKETTH
jgi:hypothetical protein